MDTALIIGNGTKTNKKAVENISYNYVICADGGLERVKEYGITPNIIIGDFDSVNISLLKQYENIVPIEKFPSEKDLTDMELGVEFAISKGYTNIVLIGATGSRLDHTMANIMLMEKYHKDGISLTIIDNNNKMSVISGYTDFNIELKEGYFLSIIPITDSIKGLSLEGFKYNLDNVNIKRGSTLCISNQIILSEGRIILKEGTAIVFISKD